MVRLLLVIAAGFVAACTAAAGASAGTPWFEDVALDVGIEVYYPGEGLESPPVEYVGGGVCWGDFDGDGFDDLFFTMSNLNDTTLRAVHEPKSKLYRNNGDGTFTDVSVGSGASFESWGLGCAVADYDSDGDFDIFYSGHSESTLLRNDGPFRFTNVTLAAGVSMLGKCAPFMCFSTGPSFTDVNADGCLDLYVVNYGNHSVDAPPEPTSWPGQANVFFENQCDGTFLDKTVAYNLDDDPDPMHSRSFQSMWCDADGDGRRDVYITADGAPNSLLRQRADGSFEDVAAAMLVRDPLSGMGLEADDIDGDGWCDLYMTHYTFQHNSFYVNAQNGTFTQRSGEGELDTDLMDLAWGTGFVDFDNDGRKDIYVANGHTHFEPDIANESRRFYLQNEDGSFRDVTAAAGPGMTMKTTARGSAWSDYDFDGDVDIAIENLNNQTSNLLRASNVTGGWLEVQLRDPASANGFAVGAVVRVQPVGMTVAATRIVHAGASFLSQNSYTQHFGLGAATAADVTVTWPDGGTSAYAGVPGDRVVRLTRGDPAPQDDTLAPLTTATVAGPATNGWFTAPAEVTLAAVDRGVTRVSGVVASDISVNGGAWAPFTTPITLHEGTHNVAYRSRDAAGNVEPVRTLTVRVDETDPTVALDVTGPQLDDWFTALPTVTIAAADTPSGVAALHAAFDGAAWQAMPATFTLPAGDGARSVAARATDAAGRSATTPTQAFLVDTNPPLTVLEVASGPSLRVGDVLDITSATRFSLSASDGAGAGVAATTWRLDAGAPQPFSGPFDVTGPDGARTLRFASTDAVGHAEEPHVQRLFLDNLRPPSLDVVTPKPGFVHVADAAFFAVAGLADLAAAAGHDGPVTVVAGTVTVRAFAGQDVSGVAWTRVLVDGVERHRTNGDAVAWPWPTATESAGTHVLSVETADGLGNVRAVTLTAVVVGGSA